MLGEKSIKQKKYFITYHNSNYYIQSKHLTNLVKQGGHFDKVINFNKSMLDSNFKEKFNEILKLKKGGGYWIWKINIIEQVMKELNEGDILVYSDAGSTYNNLGSKRLNEYFSILNSSNSGNLRFKLKFIEREWTTQEIFEYFKIDLNSEFALSNQMVGGHLLFKKNKNSLKIINEFNNLINFNPKLITDFYNTNQSKYFKNNRHDQSIWSLLSKIYGCEILEDETFFELDSPQQFKYPFLAVRNRLKRWQKVKFILNYKNNLSNKLYFEEPKYFYNKPTIYERIKFKLNEK